MDCAPENMALLTTHPQADLLVTSEGGIPHLLIETKRGSSDAATMASAWHERAANFNATCFLLYVTTDKFWLWAPGAGTPIFEGATSPLLERYINFAKVPLNQLSSQAFTSLVYSWLSSVIFKPAEVLLTIPAQKWLVETGLHILIERGYIQRESSLL